MEFMEKQAKKESRKKMSQSLSNEQQFFADIARILQTGRSQA